MLSDEGTVLLTIFLPFVIPAVVLLIRAFRRFSGFKEGATLLNETDHLKELLADILFRKWGRRWMIFQVLISFMSGGLYVVGLYTEDDGLRALLFVTDGFLTVFFLIDYVLWFFMARHKLAYFFSFFALVDIYTILPFFIALFLGSDPADRDASVGVQAVGALRVLRMLRTHRLLQFSTGSLQRQMMVVCLTLVNFLFIFTCFVQLVEDTEDNTFEFHDSLWFTVITSTTVGYGDIFPLTKLGRFLVMVIVFLGIAVIPTETGKLITLANNRNPHATRSVPPSDTQHVICLGSGAAAMPAIVDFFKEFYHADNGLSDTQLVILLDTEPTPFLKRELRNPFFASRITYLQGSPLLEADLRRAGADFASACFIMVNQLASNAKAEDATAVMRCVAVKSYNPDLLVISQLTQRTNIPHMRSAGADHVVCLDELKMGLMAANCVAPGFSTLVMNLVNSFAADSVKLVPGSWEHEYAQGYEMEIYSETVSSTLEGMSFHDATFLIYSDLGATMFAVEVELYGYKRIWLNPGSEYTLRKGDTVFLIAPDINSLDSPFFSRSYENGLVDSDDMDDTGPSSPARGDDGSILFSRALLRERGIDTAEESWMTLLSKPVETPSRLKGIGARLLMNKIAMEYGLSKERHEISHVDLLPEWAQDHPYTRSHYTLEESLWRDWERVDSDDPDGGDNIWKRIYTILDGDDIRSVEECTLDAHSGIEGHVIIAGSMSGLPSFIFSLRSTRHVLHVPIVIVNPEPPSSSAWHVIRRMPNVYYFQGNHMSVTDLLKIEIRKALRFIVLASRTTDGGKGDIMMKDSNTIFAIRSTERLVPDRSDLVFCELVYGDNMRYLTEEREEDLDNFHFALPFAAGFSLTSRIMDSMLVQVYVNPDLIDIVRQFIGLGDDAIHAAISSQLFQTRIPKELIGRPFVHVFEFFTKEFAVLPLALYRRDTKVGNRYVFTNPASDTIIRADDRCFVLSRGTHTTDDAPPSARP